MNIMDTPILDRGADGNVGLPGYSWHQPVAVIRPEGSGVNGLWIMGEASGQHEEIEKLPFRPHAPSGSVLTRALVDRKIRREQCLISNAVWYRPPNNWLVGAPYENEAIAWSRPKNQELLRRSPRCILALGAVAFHEVTGMRDIPIEKGRGFLYTATPMYGSLPVVTSYHPVFLVRGSKEQGESGAKTEKKGGGGGWQLYGVFRRDLQLAYQIAQTGLFDKHDLSGYRLHASQEDWAWFTSLCHAHPDALISYDFETPLSTVEDETEFERALSGITQVQVGIHVDGKGFGVVTKWDPSLLPLFRQVMELPNPKLDWNGRKFDRPILDELRIQRVGTYVDGMTLWHHMEPDLPMGLQYAASFVSPQMGAWKHLFAENMMDYGVRDIDEPLRIVAWCRKQMAGVRLPDGWDLLKGYDRQVLTLEGRVMDPLQRRGIPIDIDRRDWMSDELTRMEQEVVDKLQPLVPEEICRAKQADGLKGAPQEMVKAAETFVLRLWGLTEWPAKVRDLPPEVRQQMGAKPLEQLKADRKNKAEALAEAGDRWVAPSGNVYRKRLFSGGMRWCLITPFNPNSSDQLLDYIRWKVRVEEETIPKYKRKWYVPVTLKEKDETTGKKEIVRLWQKVQDPVLQMVIEAKEYRKMRGTYVDGWKPGEDGCVHPFYSTKPATGQKSSEDPNGLNFPKHLHRKVQVIPFEEWQAYRKLAEQQGTHPERRVEKVLGKWIRSMVRAKPGYRIIELDYRAFHVLTTGYEAGDQKYMRLARLDMHSYVAATQLCRIAKSEELLALSDKDLKAQLKAFRKDPAKLYPTTQGLQDFEFVRGKQAKPGILGYGFGMQAYRLWYENQEFIADKKGAQNILDGLDAEFEVCAAWRRNLPKHVHDQQGVCLTKYGYQRKFYNIFSFTPVRDARNLDPRKRYITRSDGKVWEMGYGDDAEAVIALRPANDAFGMVKETELNLEEDGLGEKFGYIIPLHDALIFHCLDEYADECLEEVQRRMELPSSVLLLPDGTGLRCEAEASISPVGGGWDEMQDI